MGLNSASTTALIDRLEGMGLVCREHDTRDRRRVLLTVQDKAVAMGWSFFGPLSTPWSRPRAPSTRRTWPRRSGCWERCATPSPVNGGLRGPARCRGPTGPPAMRRRDRGPRRAGPEAARAPGRPVAPRPGAPRHRS
ncbi:MarR family transcriptional regulator [Streptomyces sulfonofaciens]|uniref:MarR family transcriptional regulator n=1 Tax=Streptomyces sulfonofaciens TaxID=68272 RepID=UPI001E4A3AA7|nr:MarR family transcriptional regulator [Streptomyces sulfonofaciens]